MARSRLQSRSARQSAFGFPAVSNGACNGRGHGDGQFDQTAGSGPCGSVGEGCSWAEPRFLRGLRLLEIYLLRL